MSVFEAILTVPVFIILLIVILHTVRSGLNFGEMGSFFISVCVSILAMIAMRHFLKGSLEMILLPYAALGIAIMLIIFVSFFYRCLGRRKEGNGINNKYIKKTSSTERKKHLR